MVAGIVRWVRALVRMRADVLRLLAMGGVVVFFCGLFAAGLGDGVEVWVGAVFAAAGFLANCVFGLALYVKHQGWRSWRGEHWSRDLTPRDAVADRERPDAERGARG